jgi:hypothetical protein
MFFTPPCKRVRLCLLSHVSMTNIGKTSQPFTVTWNRINGVHVALA